MTAMEIGTQLVNLCKQGKNSEAVANFYAADIVSVEAMAPQGSPESRGLDAIKAKSKWWNDNHQVHSAQVLGPFPHGNRFAVYFKYEMTIKASGEKKTMEEVGLYTVEKGKICREEFFYKGMS